MQTIGNQKIRLNGGGRNPYYDSLKFVLIVFVVIAHVFEPTKNDGKAYLTVYNWINMFHMPLFIFISGRFSAMKDRKRYITGIVKILETYIVFQVIWRVYGIATGTDVTLRDWLIPFYTMWYLFSLVIWRIMIFFVAGRLKENPILWIAVSICISLVVGFIPLGAPLSFQRTLGFLPFFVAGYCTRNIEIDKWTRRIPIWVSILILLSSVLTLIPIEQNIKMTDVFCCAKPYLSGHQIEYMFARALFIIITFFMCVSIMRITPSNNSFSIWGKKTLFIYVYHSFATYSLFYLFQKGIIPSTFIFLLLYSAFILAVLLILSKWNVLSWVLNPITSIKKK